MNRTPSSYHVQALLTPGGLWRASVKELPGVQEQHRSLAQMERRVRRAIASTTEGLQPEDVRLDIEYSTGDSGFDHELATARAKRELADELAQQARKAAVPLAQRLVRAGVSHRDAGTLLGTSGGLVTAMIKPKS
ncbi:hypothetical protein [Streptomyces sp. CB03238]|uniref:hypothetical protein n=1 Tax=Streptomyces sp. CB03238 TaxID=1907777 RepID=UPI000A0FA5D3|nr:hypothetical protein [Streptomyces sp. CB03238]ORT54203.1 hypothetical protein BKD26_36025 [Streptomyces sp. CB03238]